MAASSSTLFFFAVLCFVVASVVGNSFRSQNFIRSFAEADVENGPINLELFKLLGGSRQALSFARFAVRHGKVYGSVEEIVHRFRIFINSVDLIMSHNSKKLPYQLGINEFADMSWDEFQTHHLGAAQNCSATGKGNHILTDEKLPETKDWREDNIVSPVKSQGNCGSCWTFSTTGALEAAYTQQTGEAISLSEQQLVDCAGGFNNFGCNGGLPSQAFEYIKYNGGLDTEESYPYVGANGACHFRNKNVGVKIADSVNITEGSEDELKHAVGLIRPVSVAYQVIHDFRFYKSGVFTSENCGSGSMDVNHAVLAVGYGVENGMPYWLIKNSWGPKWGMNGYFKMEMGKNMCGVATCASYPIIENQVFK
ncbi:Cathepsin L-like cysteine proteinase [Zostera marina]|uniref:Cathepsin L-like cysteine proteinase n=1 Tax=Zostera marina TaxID=29655 RepID=A0A0K9PUC2_ZOSMR|nr:Cathepsin L-like cysteine proteinase [Zostera marina]